ncbi:phosphoketolase [Tomitella fengzijianii]|uniref:Phosphoketolase family protein n=1 Tax=Tomitella fengzijianii TaxID=2597660 RepID=A0A516X2N3_9ACTN|nr:phosphoketolase family protein [Tomitella fengzijianii]QDQ97349.1 phosphoketolase family protein [Tomitella fengzijianii]
MQAKHAPGGRVDLAAVDAQWRAANYLAAGQLYLDGDPLLRQPLRPDDLKPRVVGHWGTVPGLTLVYSHFNRIICERDLDVVFVAGPGHGGPALLAHTFLEGSLGERDPSMPRDEAGMQRLFQAFSTPGGIPSHAAPNVPGSINEGGELGYSLAHACGAVFDAPDALAVCVVGDGEAETGPLAASWHSTSFLDPVVDGAVLPVLHLNGYKIAGPTVLARMDPADLRALLRGYGYEPVEVAGAAPEMVHADLAAALDGCVDRIDAIQSSARAGETPDGRLRWPMIVLRTPKGWTGPSLVDGTPIEGTFRAHQVPLAVSREATGHLTELEDWLRSYRPQELFDADGRPTKSVLRYMPDGDRRMGANPRANAGGVRRDLDLPDPQEAAVPESEIQEARQGSSGRLCECSPTAALGRYLRTVIERNPDTFRLFSPDEADSNKLSAVFETTDRVWRSGSTDPLGHGVHDENLGPHGRVMEVLSEHLCEGWLEGYLLTGRHGMLATYEAFAHVVDSMVGQYAKWLEGARAIDWRQPPASLNLLLTSHAWRQDHNGFSHQDPGFIDLVMNKKNDLVRVLFPPDANALLAVADEALSSVGRMNVIVAGKHPSPVYRTLGEAREHCARGMSIWPEEGTEDGAQQPDVVLACAGEVPTAETVAAARLLSQHVPHLQVRVVNVVDLLRMQTPEQEPRGLSDDEFDALFARDSPVIFAYHGYPSAVHRLTYRRACHANLHVHGYLEEGTTTTPFDMLMLNGMDRYSLALDALARARHAAGDAGPDAAGEFARARAAAKEYTRSHGADAPDLTRMPPRR